MPVTDAVVIGSGPNGLVAANLLADRGWEVTVLEAQNAPGGAVRSDSEVHPGFVHDTFSLVLPAGGGLAHRPGPAPEGFGLHWEHAPAVAGTPFLSGEWALMHRTPEATAEALDAMSPGDGGAWLELCAGWQRIGDAVLRGILEPFPPVRAGLGIASQAAASGWPRLRPDDALAAAEHGRPALRRPGRRAPAAGRQRRSR